MTNLDKLNDANVAAGRVNDYLVREGVADRVVYTSSVGGTLNFELRFIGRAESFHVTKRLFEEFKHNGFKIISEYISWADKEFVIRLQWLPRYVRPQTEEEIVEARRMAEAMESAFILKTKLGVNVDYIGAENGKFYFTALYKVYMMCGSDSLQISGKSLDHIRTHGFKLETIKIDINEGMFSFNLVWVGDVDE